MEDSLQIFCSTWKHDYWVLHSISHLRIPQTGETTK